MSEPGIGVAIFDESGTVVFANEQISKIFLDRVEPKVVGRNLTEFFPEEFVRENARHIQSVVRERKPIAVRDVWHGRQIWSIIRPIDTDHEESARFLVTSRHVAGAELEPPEGYEMRNGVVELGPLDVLTSRELEVLALIGQGLITKEIAAVLHCSPRTVEVHKRNIARKLNETDRVKLAKMAFESGISVKDAKRDRLESE